MALAVTVSRIHHPQGSKEIKVYGTIVASGNYPTGGDTLNLLSATYNLGQGPPASSRVPIMGIILSVKANTAEFQYLYIAGTTQANGVMQIYTGAAAQSGLAELSAGAYPAGVTGDTINFMIVFLNV